MYAELERIKCTKCLVYKDANEFSNRNARKKGKASWCKPCLNQWRRDYKKLKVEFYADYEFKRGLRRNYSTDVETYLHLLETQNHCCACCGEHKSKFKRRLHVDHDHETGQIRALLCTECNPGIGYFKHSIERLELAIKYLQKFKK